MNYEQSLEFLAKLGPELMTVGTPDGPAPRKFTLDSVRTLLERLDRPQAHFPAVLIAGTNGKGSTAATLAGIGAAAGLRIGLYTSPHLLHVNERVRTTHAAVAQTAATLEPIADEEFARVLTVVDAAARELTANGKLPNYPSFFELLTAVAFVYFAEQRVQLAVLEVGLGGRLDATNVVDPIVSVITDIAMDHMDYLGHTISEIAGEKAGILRDGGVLVTLSQHPEANAAIGEAAVAKGVRGVDASRYLPPMRGGVTSTRPAVDGSQPTTIRDLLPRNSYELVVEGEVLEIDSPLTGQHQQRNLALAIAAAVELRTNHGFAITNEAMEAGVHDTVWPGRLELLQSPTADDAPLLLDVAHNPAGAWTLRSAVAQLPEAMPRTLIFSCLRDKQVKELAQVLFPLFDARSSDPQRRHDHIVLAPIQNPRAAPLDELLAVAHAMDVPAHAAPHLPAALQQARAVTPANGLIVATGSVFLVGELRALAIEQAAPANTTDGDWWRFTASS